MLSLVLSIHLGGKGANTINLNLDDVALVTHSPGMTLASAVSVPHRILTLSERLVIEVIRDTACPVVAFGFVATSGPLVWRGDKVNATTVVIRSNAFSVVKSLCLNPFVMIIRAVMLSQVRTLQIVSGVPGRHWGWHWGRVGSRHWSRLRSSGHWSRHWSWAAVL